MVKPAPTTPRGLRTAYDSTNGASSLSTAPLVTHHTIADMPLTVLSFPCYSARLLDLDAAITDLVK